MMNKSRLDTWHEREYSSVSVKVICPKWLHNNMFRLFDSSSVPILQAKSTILYYLSLLQTEPSSLRLTGKLYMRFLQMNIWNIIYMNCGVRYEDMMFNHVFTHRAEFYCLSRHILAVLSFSMRGIIITNISCRNSDCSRQWIGGCQSNGLMCEVNPKV